jgi:hypothetical protein
MDYDSPPKLGFKFRDDPIQANSMAAADVENPRAILSRCTRESHKAARYI